jgi:hypothetical protein
MPRPSSTTNANPTPKRDPTPGFASQVLELYGTALPDVRFPDLDLSVLQAARDELQHTQLQVERLEADLEAARSALDAEANALNQKAERALAYARIYSASDPELSARIAELGNKKRPLLAAGESAAAPRRGRRRKNQPESELFSNGAEDPPPSSPADAH